MSLEQYSETSCTACKLRKRKCNRSLPKCGLCIRRNSQCIYAPKHISNQHYDKERLMHQSILHQASPTSPALRDESSNTAGPILNSNITANQESHVVEFPSVYFLDSRISHQYHVKLPNPEPPIPPHINSIIGDVSQRLATAKTFFETIHKWLPIISKKRFFENVNPLCPVRPDYALLIVCMDVMSWVPGPDVQIPRTSTYLAAKQYQLNLETSGILSMPVLQAGILIAVFELGHAIYPSAFLSVAACARYGSALGLDWNLVSSQASPLCWVDAEERNRVWWAIALLDRIISIGNTERPLLIPNPGGGVCLPSSDIEWDKGTNLSQIVYTVTTPTIEWGDMGQFSLVAQATRLLGLVLKHISESPDLDEEASLLNAALTALAKVIAVEGELQDLHMMNQQAICSIALLLLHENQTSLATKRQSPENFDGGQYLKTYISEISISVLGNLDNNVIKPVGCCVREGSSFLVPFLYLGARILHRMHVENPSSESSQNNHLARYVLEVFDTRWKVAGAYLKVLEARQMIGGM